MQHAPKFCEMQVRLPRRYAWELVDAMLEHYREAKKGAVVDAEIPKKSGARLVVGQVFRY